MTGASRNAGQAPPLRDTRQVPFGPQRGAHGHPGPVLTVVVTGPAAYLSANGREHWRARADLTRQWRLAGWAHTRKAMTDQHVTTLPRARLQVLVHWPDRRRRDATNAQPTIKAATDGACVDAHALPDDDDDHLVSTEIVAVVTPRARPCLELRFYPVEEP